MPTFRCEFDVHSDVVLAPDAEALSFVAPSGHTITFLNAQRDPQGHVPGLVARVVGAASSLSSAQADLRRTLAQQLDLFAFATHSRFKIIGPRHLLEWEAGRKTVQAKAFHSSDVRYPPDPQLTATFLLTIQTLQGCDIAEFTRSALRHFRMALLDEVPEDQFMRMWHALEIMAANAGERVRAAIPCGICGAAGMQCPSCGHVPTRIPSPNEGMRRFIMMTFPDQPEVSKRLFGGRNALMHGASGASVEAACGKPLTWLVNELAAAAWNAISDSIDIGDGPELQMMTWDGDFVGGTIVAAINYEFEWTGDTDFPAEEQIPTPQLTMEVTLRDQYQPAPKGRHAPVA